MNSKRGPLALIIIDGWGYSDAHEGNAIALAATPFYDELIQQYPHTLLEAHGSRVGLPAGVMGNSEVGHLNIGSGRVIRMDVSLVDHEIETGAFFNNKVLLEAIEGAKQRGSALHLMGLCSDGQVHSSLTHLYALFRMAKNRDLDRVFIHCFLDGRDTPPSSGADYVATLQRKIDGAKQRGSALHLMGLCSDGQVHSSLTHLYALLRMAKNRDLDRVFIHCFLDGRDTPPSSGADYVATLQRKIDEIGVGRIATVIGRYYAMDRDKRWERTNRAYDLLVNAVGKRVSDPVTAIRESYLAGTTDEFVEPHIVVDESGAPIAKVQDGDSVIFFNFRPDRARQLTRSLSLSGFSEFPTPNRPTVQFVCFTLYDSTFNLPIAFPPRVHHNVLAEVWAHLAVNNYRLAETEKYAHVTYFFNGGVENEHAHEKRLLVPSPKVATYDLEPEMSAFKVTDKVLRAIDDAETDVFVINFANPDMVGHTGKLDKTIEACQYVDTCLGWITEAIRKVRGTTLITADHGNAEQMIDLLTGSPHTAHTTNPVPFHLIDDDAKGLTLRSGGALEDVAPTMLAILGLDQPEEMTGRDLRLLG